MLGKALESVGADLGQTVQTATAVSALGNSNTLLLVQEADVATWSLDATQRREQNEDLPTKCCGQKNQLLAIECGVRYVHRLQVGLGCVAVAATESQTGSHDCSEQTINRSVEY